MNNINIIAIIILILLIIFIINLFCIDHMTPINSLQIKYNNPSVLIPDQLEKNDRTENENINSALKNQPLEFNNQIFSFSKYPFVGEKQFCENDSDCSQITAKCNFIDKSSNIGVCTLKEPSNTVFNIDF